MGLRRLATAIAVLAAAASACGSEDEPDSARPLHHVQPGARAPHETFSKLHRGVTVVVPSHCGIRSVVVKGQLWLATPPLGKHNPPRGWDENETKGRFVRLGQGRGRFIGDDGQKARFRRAPSGVADPNSGCE